MNIQDARNGKIRAALTLFAVLAIVVASQVMSVKAEARGRHVHAAMTMGHDPDSEIPEKAEETIR